MARYQRMSNVYAPTLKEDPAEAELASHRLLLRAGMIRREAAGLYSYLPLAWRSILKIEQVIREEMANVGAQEMRVPILTDATLWQESGRWGAYGAELMRVTDRHDREFALGPTHEEAFTDLVRNELKSYKQLPLVIYQMQDKFRDELRPRFGLMRSREFIMKDAYSFAADQESSRACYDDQKAAYTRIFERLGVRALPVVADTGEIGGDSSVEFMAIADAGEAELVWCDCGWAADTEAGTAAIPVTEGTATELTRLETPDIHTIADLARQLDVPESATRKAFALVDGDGKPWVCIVPGDHQVNDVKASHAFGDCHMMGDEEIASWGLHVGYMGPVGLPEGVHVAADISLKDSRSWLVGANEEGFHLAGARPGRDFEVDRWVDVAEAKEGDLCPECGRPLHGARGIEVGQVFLFDDKYSTPMGATFAAEDGTERPLLMGSYGIGVSRTLAAVVEQCHDDSGICFPVPVAPYEVSVVPLSVGDDLVWPAAKAVAQELADLGIEVVLDDRDERAGVKFADNDLWGFPYQVVCGKRGVKEGICELKERRSGDKRELPLEEAASVVAGLVKEARS
jgi:prolyl-tRNA synthetase